jgi:hypothetical protein
MPSEALWGAQVFEICELVEGSMRNVGICLRLVLIVAVATHVSAQKSSTPTAARPLVLTGAIPLPNVQGRIDHFGFDPNNRLFVSALGNNTEEVIDLSAQRVVHSIAGVPTPQGVVYSPETNKLFVASRTPPRLAVFDTDSGHMVAALPCVQDSDDLYFDSARRRIYVAGGEGYISVFQQKDADHYQLLAKVPSSLGARTAGYSGKVGKKGFDRLYVAVPARANHGAEVRIYTVQD